MDYNYHTHTIWCDHATGEPSEYIERAIQNGIKYMGFSEHVPFVFPDGFRSHFRVAVEKAEEYVTEIKKIAKKYKGQIEIKVGFEMEYYPSHFNKMLENAINSGAEYLILGQHYIYEEHPKGKSAVRGKTEKTEDLKDYVACVCTGIKSGVFSYVAHPDMINFAGDKEIYRQEMIKICQTSKEYNIPLEINFLGIRGNRIYPREDFWQLVGEVGSPVTFGFDAHDAKNAYDGESLIKAKELVKKYNLNYIGKPKLIELTKPEI